MQKCIVVFFWGFFSIRPSVGFQIFLLLLKNIYFVFFVVQRKTFFLNPVSFKVIFFFKFTSSKSYHKKKLRFYVQQIFFLFLLLFFLLETYLYKYTFISLSFIYFFYIYDIISELKNICWFICKVPKLQLKCFFLAHFLSLLLFVIENSCLNDHSYLESLVRI